jgi:hypothetical protein
MRFCSRRLIVLAAAALGSMSLRAAETPEWFVSYVPCGEGASPALLEMYAEASNAGADCPLLEEEDWRMLLKKYAETTAFVWDNGSPTTPNTCFSGSVDGLLTYFDENGYLVSAEHVEGVSESALRVIPVPLTQDAGGFGIFAASVDQSLQAGGAVTAVSLQINDDRVDLLLDDHLLVTTADGADTEDYVILGSEGDLALSGRLYGWGQVTPGDTEPYPAEIVQKVFGVVCVRQPSCQLVRPHHQHRAQGGKKCKEQVPPAWDG